MCIHCFSFSPYRHRALKIIIPGSNPGKAHHVCILGQINPSQFPLHQEAPVRVAHEYRLTVSEWCAMNCPIQSIQELELTDPLRKDKTRKWHCSIHTRLYVHVHTCMHKPPSLITFSWRKVLENINLLYFLYICKINVLRKCIHVKDCDSTLIQSAYLFFPHTGFHSDKVLADIIWLNL